MFVSALIKSKDVFKLQLTVWKTTTFNFYQCMSISTHNLIKNIMSSGQKYSLVSEWLTKGKSGATEAAFLIWVSDLEMIEVRDNY